MVCLFRAAAEEICGFLFRARWWCRSVADIVFAQVGVSRDNLLHPVLPELLPDVMLPIEPQSNPGPGCKIGNAPFQAAATGRYGRTATCFAPSMNWKSENQNDIHWLILNFPKHGGVSVSAEFEANLNSSREPFCFAGPVEIWSSSVRVPIHKQTRVSGYGNYFCHSLAPPSSFPRIGSVSVRGQRDVHSQLEDLLRCYQHWSISRCFFIIMYIWGPFGPGIPNRCKIKIMDKNKNNRLSFRLKWDKLSQIFPGRFAQGADVVAACREPVAKLEAKWENEESLRILSAWHCFFTCVLVQLIMDPQQCILRMKPKTIAVNRCFPTITATVQLLVIFWGWFKTGSREIDNVRGLLGE